MFPILQRKGVVASTAIISTYPVNNRGMTLEQIRTLEQSGWEIMSHTATHPPLSTLSLEQLEYELGSSKTQLASLGFNVSETVVFPFGDFNRTVLDVACKHYHFAMQAWGGINTGQLDPLRIKRVAFGAYTGGRNTEAFYRSLVDTALANNGWLVFMLHPFDAEFDATQQQRLADIIDYIQIKNIPILTVRDALKRIGYSFANDLATNP